MDDLMNARLRTMSKEFDEWALGVHKSADEEVESLSDAGYWKWMCYAAWVRLHHPNDALEFLRQELLGIRFEEAEPAAEGDEEPAELRVYE